MPSQLVPIPLGVAGIDTRSDPKAVRPPALAVAENASFRKPGAIEKRYGTAPMSALVRNLTTGLDESITGALRIDAVDDLLLMSTTHDVYAWTPSLDRWTYHGPRSPWTSQERLSGTNTLGVLPQLVARAVTSSLDVRAYVGVAAGPVADIYVSVYDATSGAPLVIDQVLFSAASGSVSVPIAVAVGDRVMIFGAKAPNLYCAVFSPATPTSWIVTTPITDLAAGTPRYHAAASTGRAVVGYVSTTALTIKHCNIDTAGILDGSTSQATTNTASYISVAVESTSRAYGLAWYESSTTSVFARAFNEAGTGLYATQTVATTPDVQNITCAFDSASKLHVLYQDTYATPVVYHGAVTIGGTPTTGVRWFRHAYLATHAWTYSGRVFAGMMDPGSGLGSGVFIGRCASVPGSTGRTPDADRVLVGRVGQNGAASWGQSGLPSVQPTSTGASFALAYFLTATTTAEQFASADISAGLLAVDLSASTGQFAAQMGAGLWTGSLPLSVDRGGIYEAGGFLLDPPAASGSAAAGGSLTADSTYSYKWFYEWHDQLGRRHRSSAIPVSVAITGANRKVTFTIQTLSFTLRTSELGLAKVAIVGYRNTPGGTVYYRVTSGAQNNTTGDNRYIANDVTADTVSFTDALADTTLETHEPDYLSANEIDNVSLPATAIVAAGNNRIFAGGFFDDSEIRPSKLRTSLEALAFSDLLTTECDAGDGPLTALAVLGDDLVAFREHQTYLIGGDGPGNSGTGGEFTPPRTLSDEVGCVSAASVVRTPAGIMFQSDKGIYLLGEGGQLAFIGAGVHGELDGDITSAVAMPDSHEVRFTMADKTLVYDYSAQAWSTWTVGALSACLWRGQWCVLTSSTGTVLGEVAGTFTDNGLPYSLRVRTPWIRMTAMQGYHMFKRLLFLGEQRSAHVPLVRIAYDFEPAWVDEYPWEGAPTTVGVAGMGDAAYGSGVYGGETDDVPATTVYQFQVRPSQPRAQAIQVEFVDVAVAGGDTLGESYSLSELAMDVAVKQGPMRLGEEKSA